MKNRAVATIAAFAALSLAAGCSTTSFAGLAKASHVEQLDASVRTTAEDVAALQDEVAAIKAAADRMQELAARMEETRRTTAALQELAAQVEGRLKALPRETLEMLVDAIEAYLAR